jgi:hypothetical protein
LMVAVTYQKASYLRMHKFSNATGAWKSGSSGRQMMIKKKAVEETRSLETLDKLLAQTKNYEEYAAIRDGLNEAEQDSWFERRFLAADKIQDKLLTGVQLLVDAALQAAEASEHSSAADFADFVGDSLANIVRDTYAADFSNNICNCCREKEAQVQ